MNIFPLILPELTVLGTACVLFLLGMSGKLAVRRAVPVVALVGLLAAIVVSLLATPDASVTTIADSANTLRLSPFGQFFKTLIPTIGLFFILMSWPSGRYATGNASLSWDFDAGEYFSLVLCAIAGCMLVGSANDAALLFMGFELASIPTYILVSMSRPTASAQEAGVKYFFLGAMSAAILLFGFSYLYGTTGTSNLLAIAGMMQGSGGQLTPWLTLAFTLIIVGFGFKLAAVPTHVYAADVYQGAATPITALLSFIPKATGTIAIIKILYVAGGGIANVPQVLIDLLWYMAVLTMTVGNVLGLMQFNLKRVFAYSSIAHSGYILVGLTAYAGSAYGEIGNSTSALHGVLFYLTSYGVMNAGAFAVLMMLPTRARILGPNNSEIAPPATTAETYEDLRGVGRKHPVLAFAMAICCFSLIGLPLTVGFFGKLYLIRPALGVGMVGLVIWTMINAAISAAYYLRIVGTMFLQDPEAVDTDKPAAGAKLITLPLQLAAGFSVIGTLALFLPPVSDALSTRAAAATVIETATPAPTTMPALADAR